MTAAVSAAELITYRETGYHDLVLSKPFSVRTVRSVLQQLTAD